MTRGLLTRLEEGRLRGRSDADLTRSVMDNLRVLLNTRQGDSASVPEFGVPDFTDCIHNFPAGLRTLQRYLQQAISNHEPRLSRVQVRFIGVDEARACVHFEVRARLTARPDQELCFSTRVMHGARVLVGS